MKKGNNSKMGNQIYFKIVVDVCRSCRVGKKAGNTHIFQDGGKYWEIRLILNLQI